MKQRTLIWSLFFAVALLIFFADTIADTDISVSVLYVILIIIVLRTGAVHDLIIAGIGCVFLTVFSYAITPGFGHEHKAALINCALSLFAIISSSYLSIKTVTAEAATRKVRDQIAQISRATSMAELTASIAHEINQPLSAIGANAGAAKRWLNASPPDLFEARKSIDAILRNAERAGGVVNGLRRLISAATAERRSFDIIELITETIGIMRLDISERHVDVETHFSHEIPFIIGDRVLIQQIIVNIISNSLEAMADVNINNRKIVVAADTYNGGASISIRDTGIGVAPELLDRLFDAFYSTKPTGMGIGLAISRSIAEAHGGSVTASHNTPRGMVFELILPNQDPN